MKNPTRTLPGTLAIALALGVTLTAPVGASTRDGGLAVDSAPAAQLTEAKPVEERPVRVLPDADGDRPHRDVEVLTMKCAAADAETDDTRVHVGCEWRAAENERAAGYQLWRIVGRGERELVARVGLDTQAIRDIVPADANVVRYAVLAVDANGNIVGRSRVQRVVVGRDGSVDRPTEADPKPVRPDATDGGDVVRWPLAVR